MDEDAPQGQAGFTEALKQLLPVARQRVAILSPELPASSYGDADVVELIKQFLLSNDRSQLRVLVESPDRTMKQAHRLVELGRQVSSRVEFRQLTDEQRGIDEELVIADEAAWMQRAPKLNLQTSLYLQASLNARLQLRRYDELWDRAVPARDFYVLGI
ncbi:MAG: hypothetical protein M3O62_11360 [Pseudomonadota bacterium]|nr:hypothetical protein [Pseudomonadota bacterium]